GIPDLNDLSGRLARALGYRGIAEIEFKRDTRDGRFKLIEMNPRHWDWHQLSEASGVNLSQVAYEHWTRQRAHTSSGQPHRTKWIAEDALARHLLTNPGRLREMTHLLSGKRMLSIFDWRDPIPLLRYSTATLLPAWTKSAVRKFKRSVATD